MGQYYMPYIEDVETKETTVLYSHDFGSGLKIMEHSWLSGSGNPLLNAASNSILNKPSVVAWVGDYSDFNEDCHLGAIEDLGADRYSEICQNIWGDNRVYTKPTESNKKFDYQKNRYLINNTTKEYVDFTRVLNENRFGSEENNLDGWVVHPLSLLTATSNGKGGGDYHKKYPDIDLVGSWAFHEIYISDAIPSDCDELIVCFQEKI